MEATQILHPWLQHLAREVFHTSTRWPHYTLLLEDIQALHQRFYQSRVLSLERSVQETCGETDGPSRWEGVFANLTVVNHGLFDNHASYRLYHHAHELGANWDLIINPNLLHHVRDQHGLFQATHSLMGRETVLYIFDTPFREVHDCPGDYVRYTPYGIADMLDRHGFSVQSLREWDNPWESLLYCIDYLEHEEGEYIDQRLRETCLERIACYHGNGEFRPKDPAGRRMCIAWSVQARLA